jgi:hypothetical protein
MQAVLQQIENSIASYSHTILSHSVTEKAYGKESLLIRGSVTFVDGSILQFTEFHDFAVKGKVKYRYHYMDSANGLRFRYDNAPHFKNLPTFPRHKHLSDEVIAAEEPDLSAVLSEVARMVDGPQR